MRSPSSPSPSLRRLLPISVLLLPCAALALDDRPATLAAAGGNPLALSATAFLSWYWTLLLVLTGIAVTVRLLNGHAKAPVRSSAGVAEDPYLVAFLAGGAQRVLEAVMTSLVQQGALRVNTATRELIAELRLPPERPQIERHARNLLMGTRKVEHGGRFRSWLERELKTSLTPMRQRLLQAGLLAQPALQVWAVIPLRLGFGALLGIGAIRLVAGIAAGRPVGFLVLSMILTGGLAWWSLRGLGKERATAHGARVLEQSRSQLGRRGEDRLWMVALLGRAGYGLGPMADLDHVMRPPSNSSSGDGGGGGGGDGGGGGCGGGGCGG